MHGIRSITSHSTAFFSITLRTATHVVHRLRRLRLEIALETLHVLALDRVQLLVTQRGHQMHAQDHFLGRDAAWLLAIRSRVAVHETRRELSQCRNVFLFLDELGMRELVIPMSLPLFSPSLGR